GRVARHAAAAAPADRAEPHHLRRRIVPCLQPVLHHDSGRAGDEHSERGHGDLRHRVHAVQHRPGQRDVGGAGDHRRPDHVRAVLFPATEGGVMASPGGTRTGGAVRDRPMTDGGTPGRGAATRRSSRRRRGGGQGWYLVAGTLVSAVFVVPLGWEVIRSLQPESAVISAPSSASFSHLGIANYQALLSGSDDILRNVINSLIVAVLTAILTALVATLAGYGFALFRFRGSGLLFGVVLVAFMVPFQAVLTPAFLEMHDLHLLNNLAGIGLFYTAFNLPFGV